MIFIFGVFLCFGTKKVVGGEQQQKKKKKKENTVLSENKIEAHIQCDIPLVLVMSVFLFQLFVVIYASLYLYS